MAAPTTGSLAAREPIGADVWRVVVVICLGTIMSVLDMTIVNVALNSLAKDLHGSLDSIQWVITGYLLSIAAVIPISGWASRRFGAKRVYLGAIVVFTLGSVLCGIATSPGELILFRVFQGIGGGLIMPVGQMITVRKAGPRRLARVMSAMGIPTVLAPVIGPTLGGILVDTAGWRWIFFVNLPVGILTVIAALRLLPREEPEDAGSMDFAGLVLVGGGLVGVTYGLAELGTLGTLASVRVAVPLVAGLLFVAGFVIRSRRIARPLLDLRLYANRAFAAASVTTFSLGAAIFGGMILLPLYFQNVRHEDPTITGMLLAPMGLGVATGMWISGRSIDRFGAGATAVVGGLIAAGCTIPFVLLNAHSSYLLLDVTMVCRGVGVGLSMMPSMTAAYRLLKPNEIADATPQLNISQRVGGSIGTALVTVILQRDLIRAGSSVSAQAAAFGSSFWWVFVVALIAVGPAAFLMRAERRIIRNPAVVVEPPHGLAPTAVAPGTDAPAAAAAAADLSLGAEVL